jgi:hypothetical protein
MSSSWRVSRMTSRRPPTVRRRRFTRARACERRCGRGPSASA